jgi:nucleoside-diphosphate-sugar epimerase
MTSYLVTGGAGFIGSNLVAELVSRRARVRVLDNFTTGKRENLEPYRDQIELIEGSLTDLETVRSAVQGVDIVLHQGALPSVPRSIEQPINTNDVNVTGTLNVLVAGKEFRVRKIVLASSSSVYGNTEESPKHEGMRPKPLSPYAVSKMTCENYARVFYEIYGLPAVVLRYFNVFGPRQNPDSQYSAVIPKFIKAMLAGKSPVIYGDGSQSRDFSFVQNVIEANILASNASEANGKAMNIACQESYSLLDLIQTLNSILGTSIHPSFEPPRKGEVKHSLADISLARACMGYKPSVKWKEGLVRTVEWYRRNSP